MYSTKFSYLPEPTLQASDRATESTFQASARSYLRNLEEVMKKYPSDGQDPALHVDQPKKNLRKLVFDDQFKQDLKYWENNNPDKLKRIRKLIESILHDPFKGEGHPEPLKYQGSGVWSRKIDKKHRIVYLVRAEQIDFLQARFHYDDK